MSAPMTPRPASSHPICDPLSIPGSIHRSYGPSGFGAGSGFWVAEFTPQIHTLLPHGGSCNGGFPAPAIVGCVGLQRLSGGSAELRRMSVSQAARGGGIARRLTRHLLAHAAAQVAGGGSLEGGRGPTVPSQLPPCKQHIFSRWALPLLPPILLPQSNQRLHPLLLLAGLHPGGRRDHDRTTRSPHAVLLRGIQGRGDALVGAVLHGTAGDEVGAVIPVSSEGSWLET